MLGAIYIGLSGLSAYSEGLKTISNNVANLNTPGFKSNDVRFSDLYTNSGAGSSLFDHGNSGGNGVRLDDVRLDFRQGDLRQSQNGLDLAVEGAGFFVLLDGARTLYTRTGNFAVDADGYVVLQGTDYKLGILNASGQAAELNVDSRRTSPPIAHDGNQIRGQSVLDSSRADCQRRSGP